MSLVKFANRVSDGNNGKLWWSRAQQDGAPFRGPIAPNLTQEEFEDRVERVADAKNGTFYTGDEKQNKIYLDVLDKCANGWGQLLWIERRFPKPDDTHYYVSVEWLEYYLQDGTPTQGAMGHGQQQIPGTIG